MKRAAEKQLVKDHEDEGDDDQEGSESGFRKADESVLARRPMRALPRRTGLGSAPVPAAITTEAPIAPPSKFAGFSGFGASAASTTPFSFSSAPAPAPPAAPKLSPAIPAAPSSNTGSTQPTSLFGGPPVSLSASPATKAFASIVGSSSPSSESAAASSSNDYDQGEVDYYKALRGLNVSFLSAVSKAIESDPFVDVAELLERYKALRISVKSDYDDKAKLSTPKPAPVETKPAEPPKPASVPSMPTPPATFSGFKPMPSSTSTPPSSGGFVPKLDGGSSSLGSPFSFPSFKPAPAPASTPEPPKSAFSFGSTSSIAESATGPTSTPTSAFAFGGPSASSSSSSIFGSKLPTATTTTSIFGPPSSSSVFGSSSSSSSIFGSGSGSVFGKKDSAPDADDDKEKDKPTHKPFTFGAAATSTPAPFSTSKSSGSDMTPEKDKDSAASSSSFSFGSSPTKPSPFGGFAGPTAAKAGSIGNPVGFGFGSPPKITDSDSGHGPVKALPFSFGVPKSTSAFGTPSFGTTPSSSFGSAGAGAEKKEGQEGTTDALPAPTADGDGAQSAPSLAASSVHDLEGEGEEDEETTHAIRSKVFKMTKDNDGKAQWGDLGVGVLRLKKHKETSARRVLLRNSSTGKITINFMLHSAMNPSASDKIVSFMGHHEGVSTPYRIRCKTADQAKELKAALDRELEFVKSKDL